MPPSFLLIYSLNSVCGETVGIVGFLTPFFIIPPIFFLRGVSKNTLIFPTSLDFPHSFPHTFFCLIFSLILYIYCLLLYEYEKYKLRYILPCLFLSKRRKTDLGRFLFLNIYPPFIWISLFLFLKI